MPYEKFPIRSCHPSSNSIPLFVILPAFTGENVLPTTVDAVIPETIKSFVSLL